MFFMPRHHFGSMPRKAVLRSGTRSRPALTLAILGAGACAAMPLTARAQKAAPSPPRAAAPTPSAAVGPGDPIGPAPIAPAIPFNVSTYHYDNSRSGVNNLETILTPANVSQTTFGKLFAQQLDGPTYGQPLYYANLTLTNSYTGAVSTHNAVFVATNNNTIYAFDADTNTGTNTTPLWSINFNSPINGITPTSGDDITNIFGLPQAEITPLIGIVGTPVMDPANKVLYVVVRTTEGSNYAHRLHAIDITTGLEKSYSPQLIGQQEDVFGDVSPVIVPGTGDDPYSNGYIFFDTATQNQRAALTLVNGTVYVAYGAFDNTPPFHGWMFSFDAATLNPQAVYCTTPNENNTFGIGDAITTGGINMSGAGPAADAAALPNAGLYFNTGSGNYDPTVGSYGESVLKLSSARVAGPVSPYRAVPTLLPAIPYGNPAGAASSFTPFNYALLRDFGNDIGTGGVALIPGLIPGHPKTLITAGQEGRIYLLDGDNLGGYNSDGTGLESDFGGSGVNDSGAIATFQYLLGQAYGVPAVFTSVAGGASTTTVYYHTVGQPLQPFKVNPAAATPGQLLTANPVGNANFDFPGAMPIISANAGQNGILWELESRPTAPADGVGGILNVPNATVLHAYNATAIPAAGAAPAVPALKELFNSQGLNGIAGGANGIGDYIQNSFPQPVVANGKVYVTAGTATQTNGSGNVGPTPTTGTLVVFGIPAAASLPTRGYHYLLSGPLSTNFTNGGAVVANRTNYYSLTAVDASYRPVKVNNTDVILTLTNQATGRRLSLGSVHFSNQSYQVFSRAIPQEVSFSFLGNSYTVQGHDNSGNTINTTTLGVIPSNLITGFGSPFDHYNVRLSPSARSGQTTTISLTAVNQNGIAIPYNSYVDIYDTVPNGVQDFNPRGTGYAYGNIQNTFLPFPNVGVNGSYSITFNTPGTHVIVIYDYGFFGISNPAPTTTTVTVNVL